MADFCVIHSAIASFVEVSIVKDVLQLRAFISFCATLYNLWFNLDKTHNSLMTDHKRFLKMCTKKTILYLAAKMNFHPYFPHSLSNLGEIQHSWLHTESLQICDFHEDQHREGQIFLTSMTLHLHAYRVTEYTGLLISPYPNQEGNKLHSPHFMELGGSLPHSQESSTRPYPSHINPFLRPSHF